MTDNVETMFSVREVPWHGLGTIVEEKQTAKDAMILAGLDWAVEMEPVWVRSTKDGLDTYEEIPNKQAAVRDSDRYVLEIHGSVYTPVQNWKSFEFFDALVDSGEAKYETAGSLDHGRKIWLTAHVPREILIAGQDVVNLYLLLANSHDGSMQFTAGVTPVRVVCQNTLNLALSGVQQQWKLKHTEAIDGKVAEAREALNLTFEYADEFERRMNALADVEFTKREFEHLVRSVFPGKIQSSQQGATFTDEQYALIGVFESSPTLQDEIRYTKWGALNAIREYDDWGRPIRGSKTKSEVEQRTERVWGLTKSPNVPNANKVLAYLEQ